MGRRKKSFWKSKTLWVNLLIVITVVLPEMVNLGFKLDIKWVALVTLLANTVLRFMTTGPVSTKS